MHLQNK